MRFSKLQFKLGGLDQALGALVRAWTLAQKWYLTPEGMIPEQDWKTQDIPDAIIDVGLAERVDGKIRMRGANEQFAWLKQRSESGKRGGLKSQRKRRSGRSTTESDREASFSFSSSSSFSDSFSNSNSKTKNSSKGASHPREPGKTVATWEAYRDAYAKRYGEPPIRNATVNGQLAQFVSRVGQNEAPLIADFYVRHNLAFYVQRGHNVGIMVRDAEKLRTEWATGQRINPGNAREAERRDANVDAMREYLEKKGEL